MNNPAFRLAGISSQASAFLLQAGKDLRSHRLSPSGIALLGGSALVVAVSAALIIGASAPDPAQTAAVPPRVTPPQTVNLGTLPIALEGGAAVPKEARQLAAPAPDQTPPTAGNSRWGLAKSPQVAAINQAAGPDERHTDAVIQANTSAAPTGETPDNAGTASIVPDGLRGSIDVQVAETEAEVAMLEASTGMVDASASQAAPGSLDGPLPELSAAKAAKWGNLRDGPADEAKVILVVPANAAIEAETGCNWCTVVYKGQRGYMFKNLIRRSPAEEAKAGQGLF